jgi:peptide subunit release factor 1 (eRF1)
MEQLESLARSLAVFRPERGCCISLFLDLDPGEVPTAKDLSSHITSVVDDAKRRVEELSARLDHERALAAREDVESAAVFFEEELDRSGAEGFAYYVSGLDGVRYEVPLPTPVEDGALVGRAFALVPLLEPLERDRELVLAAVGRERGTLWRWRNGRTQLLDDRTEEVPRRHDQGGWSQSNFQRSIDHEAFDHLRDVADALARTIEQGSGTLLVVSCVEELRTRFEDLLAPHVREALLGWTTVEAHADDVAIEPEAERLLENRLHEEREGLLERFREERGNGGRAAASWEEAVGAAADGRIDTALVDGRTAKAWVCPKCDRGSVHAGNCEIDGTPLEEEPGGALELVVRGTLANGGNVRLVNGSRLEETEGVAALLRYTLTASS